MEAIACDDCGFRPANFQTDTRDYRKANLWTHFLRRHDCNSKAAENLRLLSARYNSTRNSERMSCDICGYSTQYRSHLGPHHFLQHEPNSITAIEIRSRTINSLREKQSQRLLICDSCQSFRTAIPSSLRIHFLLKHQPKSTLEQLRFENRIINRKRSFRMECDNCSYSTRYLPKMGKTEKPTFFVSRRNFTAITAMWQNGESSSYFPTGEENI